LQAKILPEYAALAFTALGHRDELAKKELD
jgi:hypothetical protein